MVAIIEKQREDHKKSYLLYEDAEKRRKNINYKYGKIEIGMPINIDDISK